MSTNPYQQYKKNQVEMASPQELVLLCYKGAIRHLKLALLRWDQSSAEDIHNQLIKGQAIIEELMVGLNLEDEDNEIAKNLFQLYSFMHTQLVEANNKKDSSRVQGVVQMLEELKDTWEEAMGVKLVHETSEERGE